VPCLRLREGTRGDRERGAAQRDRSDAK
jgi:hypothetical protein